MLEVSNTGEVDHLSAAVDLINFIGKRDFGIDDICRYPDKAWQAQELAALLKEGCELVRN